MKNGKSGRRARVLYPVSYKKGALPVSMGNVEIRIADKNDPDLRCENCSELLMGECEGTKGKTIKEIEECLSKSHLFAL